MVNKFKKLFINSTLSPEQGSFISDKSYKYDTVYFLSKYILDNCDNDKIFNKSVNKEKCIEYIENKFSLKKGSSAAINYLTEVINLLLFSNIILRIDKEKFKIVKYRELKLITSKIENSYIFLFILTYQTLKNENILKLYFSYINEKSIKVKQFYLDRIYDSIVDKSKRISDKNSVWAKLNVKYPMMVLGFFYKEKIISKELNISNDYINIKSISMNVNGTKSSSEIKRNNNYIFNFDVKYVENILRRYSISNK